ncbi:AAA family ATPase [Alienimonas sp. DA493]|uniref:AAA family ATPase n=1 Tax=Alienimonas sp. DA493 TaxID=3373605 RepID=UPI0037543615
MHDGEHTSNTPEVGAALAALEPFLHDATRRVLRAGLPDAAPRAGTAGTTGDGVDWELIDSLVPQAEWPPGDGPPWKRRPAADSAPVVPPDPAGEWTTLTAIPPRPVRWLWPGLIPAGKLTILAGDPGTGKSFLVLDWAARVSAGRGFPGGVTEGGMTNEECRMRNDETGAASERFDIRHSTFDIPSPRDVLLFCGEDDPADTVRPRLEAAGADLERIAVAGEVAGGRGFDLAADLPRVRAKLEALAAAGRPAGLAVIDPLAAFTASVDRNGERAVRAALDPLAALAAESGAAVVAVLHLRKDRRGPEVLGPIGSIAQTAVARSVLLASADPADPAGRLLRSAKANLSPDRAAVPFRVEGGAVRYGAVRRRPPGPAASQRERATEWIRNYLADGPKRASDAMRDGLAAGIGRSTLKLARRDLGLGKHRFHGPRGDASDPTQRATGAYWVWALPGQDPRDAA